MITRSIVNAQGQTVGQLNFPDGTSEETIAKTLAPYSASAPLNDVSPRQIRLALLRSGVTMTQIEDAIGTLPEPIKSYALIEWEFSLAFKRTNPLVDDIGLLLGWSKEQLDALWLSASKL
jgi:hypothetical protein